ncbi:hypothetical protein [Streptomyces sp. NPDC060366]
MAGATAPYREAAGLTGTQAERRCLLGEADRPVVSGGDGRDHRASLGPDR